MTLRSHVALALLLALSVLVLPGCFGQENSAHEPAPAEQATGGLPLEGCVPGAPTEAALLPAGPIEGGAIVPIGRKVTPAGRLVETVEWPLAATFSPDGAWAYVVHNGNSRLDVIDVEQGVVTESLNVPGYRGVAVSPDGETVFVSGAQSGKVYRFARQADGALEELEPWSFKGFLSTLALSADGSLLYVLSNSNSRVWQLDAETGEVLGELAAQIYPYGLVVAPDGQRVYVSNAGGDDISVLDFSLLDPETGDPSTGLGAGGLGEVALIPTDLNPMGMALDATGALLFVANSDSDNLTVIDTETLQVVDNIDLRYSEDSPVGASPNEMQLSHDGTRLYVSEADLNVVDVIDVASRALIGRIPGGFYTTGLALSPDGQRLLICNSKGFGASGSSPNNLSGSVSLVDLAEDPTEAETQLEAWTAIADANNARMHQFYDKNCAYPVPKALAGGDEHPIEHVVIILKENKTYDAVLGDLDTGRGDPELVLWGREITPNVHALAERYVNLDNYYCDSEHSTQGHNWATQADANDLFEKTDYTQTLLIGYDPSILHQERSFFDHLYDHDVSFRVYGQFVGIARGGFDRYEAFVNQKVSFFNQSIRDTLKAKEVIREMELGIFPSFIFVALPNDHTYGTKAGKPAPEVMIADNDEAVGLLVDAISRSEYWESTVIFIIQDDAQGKGGDHIHPQRSVGVVVSPWTKKGYTSSVHYSIPSVFRTTEMLFGLPPMNLNTAAAAPMYDIFIDADEAPDTSPYDGITPQVPYVENTSATYGAAESEKLNFQGIDEAPGLGGILWHYRKGADVEPPPYAKWNDE